MTLNNIKNASALAVAIMATLFTHSVIAADTCDNQCLLSVLNNYQAQMLQHDIKSIVTSKDFRSTENYMPIRLGEGYWTRIQKIFHQQQFADAVNGQTVAVGLLDDGGRDAYFALRLKVGPGKTISQSEMLLIHDGETSFLQKDRSVELNPVYTQEVPVNQRTSREEMVRAVENFSDAWQYKDGDLMSYSEDCTFSENNLMLSRLGYTTCGDMLEYNGKRGIPGAGNSPERGDPSSPIRPMTPADPSIGRPALQGPWIRDRRYPLIDVEHGVVIAYHIQGGTPARPGEEIQYRRKTPFTEVSSDHALTAEESAARLAPPKQGEGSGQPAGAPRERGAAYMMGLFKIVDGTITRIDHFEWEGGSNASGGFSDGPRF